MADEMGPRAYAEAVLNEVLLDHWPKNTEVLAKMVLAALGANGLVIRGPGQTITIDTGEGVRDAMARVLREAEEQITGGRA